MRSDQDSNISQKRISIEDIDHLSYLRRQDSILKSKADIELEKMDLVCASCGHDVTKVSEKVEIHGRHDHAFSLYREIVYLGCFRSAPGCMGVEGVSHGYSWFRGYAWQIQVCKECYTQLGWRYISQDDSFYGIVFKMLREKNRVKKDSYQFNFM